MIGILRLMRIPVGTGGVAYELRRVRGYVSHPDLPAGARVLELCDTNRCVIYVSDVPPPAKRMKVFGHDLAHAVMAECDPAQAKLINEETHCELASMGTLPAALLARVEYYLRTGVEAEDEMWWERRLIPMVRGVAWFNGPPGAQPPGG